MNPNLKALHQAFTSGKRGIMIEGAARSGKSWAVIDFLVWVASTHNDIVVNIIRSNFSAFRTSLFDDFNRRLPMFGIAAPFVGLQNVRPFQLLGARINFISGDSMERYQGMSCDIAWAEEALDIEPEVISQVEMRCRRFLIFSYNPKVTTHFLYDFERRPDITLFKSTIMDNPYASKAERDKIMSFEPTPENIERGTASNFHWKVYALGERCAHSGLIFDDITWIDQFPDEIDRVFLGGDVGQSAPSTVVRVGIEGNNLYAELLAYEPTENVDRYVQLLATCISMQDVIWIDSAAPGFISYARRKGFSTRGVRKFHGSKKFSIALVKSKKLHVVKNQHYHSFKKELDNYTWREINGIAIEEPCDNDYDHAIDALLYGVLMNVR